MVRIASDHRVPVVPRGGGSGTQGGTFALYGGIALDLTRMDRILEVDETSLVVNVEAGVTGPQLEEALSPLASPSPTSPAHSTLAPPSAAGWPLEGPASDRPSTANPRTWSFRSRLPFPPASWRPTPSVPNHAAGPGLLQLLVGSEGTMGVITSATLRMDPMPETQAFLTYEFATVFDGLEAGRRIMTQRWRPAVMRLYDEADRDKLNDILGLELTGALLVVICDGDQRLVDLESEAITGDLRRGRRNISRSRAAPRPGGMANTSPTPKARHPLPRRSSAPPTRSAPSTTCPTSIGPSARTSRRASPSTGPSTPPISPTGSLGE